MNFQYRARAADGEIIGGYIEADNQKSALNALRSRGMIVINLNQRKQVQSYGKNIFSRLFDFGVPSKSIMVFFRQFATMIQAGLNIPTAINVIIDQEKNQRFKKTLIDIKSRIERGGSLSQAMSAHSEFNSLMISLVEAGEEGGMIDNSLEQAANILEKHEIVKSKIRSAISYPLFVMCFALIVIGIFFVVLVPRFKHVFESMNIELPALTLKLFSSGEWVIDNFYGIMIFFTAFFIIMHILSLNKGFKNFTDRLKLKIPFVKNLVFKSSMARATRILSALISAGVPIMRGLEMAEGSAGNIAIQEGFAELRTCVTRGISLGDASKQAGIFPVLISQMMRIGEETGHLDNMLERVASWYDQELDEQIKSSVSFIEPLLIIFVGAIVAVIVFSIFGPITSAMSQII